MTPGQPRPLADDDPRQLGRFTVMGLLGAGGMGRVFLGCSPGGWAVAIKVIHAELADDPAFRARFAHEVAAARAVGGFYTAPVVDADTTAPRPWLAVAYAAGVVHRDLKPSNVLLAADGPRVIDFGIARAAERSSLTRTGTILGSAGFMAPEQITGAEAGPAADVFALGAVLTFAATGQGPFGEGRTEALAFRVVYAEPALDGLPGPVREIVARCLAKDPRYRPGPSEVIAALAAIPADEPGGEGWLPEPVERLVGLHRAAETTAMAAAPATGPPAPATGPPALAGGSAAPARAMHPRPKAPRRPRRWVLGAAVAGVLLAAAGGVTASKLSARAPSPTATSAGLVAGSPANASRPASPAPGLSSAAPGQSSAAPGGSPAPSGPAAVVQAYYAAINNHDCGKAWSLGGDRLSAARGQSYQQFCQGFSTTSHDTLTVESVTGHTVTVTIVAEQADGTSQTYRGSYVVGHGVIESASVTAS